MTFYECFGRIIIALKNYLFASSIKSHAPTPSKIIQRAANISEIFFFVSAFAIRIHDTHTNLNNTIFPLLSFDFV